MGVGFIKQTHSDEDSSTTNVVSQGVTKVEFQGIVKTTASLLGIIMLVSGLIWGAAMLVAGTASDDDLGKVRDRVELLEKNDLVQTNILQNIKETLDKIEKKLDTALNRQD